MDARTVFLLQIWTLAAAASSHLVPVSTTVGGDDDGGGGRAPYRSEQTDSFRCRLTEEQPAGTVVVEDLLDDTGLAARYQDRGSRVGLRFDVFEDVGDGRLFTINDAAGGRRLVTTRPLDRDELCPRAVDCTLHVKVAVKSTNVELQLLSVIVDLLDINDCPPRFVNPNITFVVPESHQETSGDVRSSTSTSDQLLPIPTAADDDSPLNGLIRYQLITVVDGFQLREDRNERGSVDQLSLAIVRPLDREATDRYQLEIIAVDSGSVRLTSTLTVNIIVSDINDHAPSFTSAVYRANITENCAPGLQVVRVEATDPDLGDYGLVRYRLDARGATSGVFRIDEKTGVVTVAGTLDYETRVTYSVTLTAEDASSQPASPVATLVVQVIDVNDNSPYIVVEPVYNDVFGDVIDSMTSLPATDILVIPDDAAPGTPIGHLIVTDADAGGLQRVTCRLPVRRNNETAPGGRRRPGVELVPVDRCEYRLETTGDFSTLMREQPQQQQQQPLCFDFIVVSCSDDGQPPMTSAVNLTLIVVVAERKSDASTVGGGLALDDRTQFPSVHEESGFRADSNGSSPQAAVDPAPDGNDDISGHVIALVTAAAGCILLAITVAVIIVCASSISRRSKSKRRIRHTRSSSALANGTSTEEHIYEATALCRDDCSVVRDDVIVPLDAEPLNYTARHQRWLITNGLPTTDKGNDVDSGFNDMTSSITSYQASNSLGPNAWIPESSFRSFHDMDIPRTFPSNSGASSFVPPPPLFHNSNDDPSPMAWSHFDDDACVTCQPINAVSWYSGTQPAFGGGKVPATSDSELASDYEHRFPSVIRVGSMVHSASAGSRKSVRFADDDDMIY